MQTKAPKPSDKHADAPDVPALSVEDIAFQHLDKLGWIAQAASADSKDDKDADTPPAWGPKQPSTSQLVGFDFSQRDMDESSHLHHKDFHLGKAFDLILDTFLSSGFTSLQSTVVLS